MILFVILPRFAGPVLTPVATARIFPAGAGRLPKKTSGFSWHQCFVDFFWGGERYVDQHNLGSNWAGLSEIQMRRGESGTDSGLSSDQQKVGKRDVAVTPPL